MPNTCPCEDAAAPTELFEASVVGCDETGGRFADVTLDRCLTCGRSWLRYFVESEVFETSARWARSPIDDAEAATVTPERAAAFLDEAPWYLYGGSYFGGTVGRRSGPITWWDA